MEDISVIRAEINEADDEICRLLGKRMLLAGKIADFKRENKLPVLDSGREEEILRRLTDGCDSEMTSCIRTVYAAIFSASRDYQSRRL